MPTLIPLGTISGGGGGTTTVDGLTDATVVGKAVVKAADQAAARSAIGAGTSSLALGTTALTALAGNTTAAAIGGVPTSRTIAGLDLSADRTAAALKAALALAVADVTGAAPLASPSFTGAATVPTQTVGDATTKIANTAFVANALAALVNSAPGALDQLNELAAALGNDPNFATTITNALALKVPTSRVIAGQSLSTDITAATLTAALLAATTTASGIVELATTAEATTGTDTVRAVTPAGAAAVLDLLRQEQRGFMQNTQPTLVYSGGTWPARTTVAPNWYTGAVIFDSYAYDKAHPTALAAAPSDMVEGDKWVRLEQP